MSIHMKRTVRLLLAVLILVSLFTAVPFTTNAAFADGGSVITWSGSGLMNTSSMRNTLDIYSGPKSYAGIKVD